MFFRCFSENDMVVLWEEDEVGTSNENNMDS